MDDKGSREDEKMRKIYFPELWGTEALRTGFIISSVFMFYLLLHTEVSGMAKAGPPSMNHILSLSCLVTGRRPPFPTEGGEGPTSLSITGADTDQQGGRDTTELMLPWERLMEVVIEQKR